MKLFSYHGKHQKQRKGAPYTAALTGLLILFMVSAAALLFFLYENRPEELPEVSLPPITTSAPPPTTAAATTAPPTEATTCPPETTQPEEPPQMLDYMRELYEQNPDLVGYLHIEGTNIDSPVVYTAGEDYYLYRGFDGKDHVAGCPFVDKHNTVDPRDANLIIHGHYMGNGTMFHDLHNYKQESYYQEHKIIRFDSLYEAAEYEIIAVFVSQVYNKSDDVFKFYQEYNFESEAAFNEFITNIRELSLYDTGVTAQYGDEFITLSTCEYSRRDGRMVVVARKITEAEAQDEQTEPSESAS